MLLVECNIGTDSDGSKSEDYSVYSKKLYFNAIIE